MVTEDRRSFAIYLDEARDGSVVGALHVIGEEARGQFAQGFVVLDTLAAFSLPAAGLVCAVAFCEVFLEVGALHFILPSTVVF